MNSQASSLSSRIAQVVALVRAHHGLPLPEGKLDSGNPENETRLSRLWKREARRNHLSARRRSVSLEDIPSTAFPVALELEHGKQFVLVKEKCQERFLGSEAYIVQFPDGRESLVRSSRLSELCDGVCVFFQSKSSHGDGIWRKIRRKLTPSPKTSVISATLGANCIAWLATAAALWVHKIAFVGEESAFSQGFGILMVSLVVAGLVSLCPHQDKPESSLVDSAFLPFHAAAAIYFAGWAALPFLIVALLTALVFSASDSLSKVIFRCQHPQIFLIALSFILAPVAALFFSHHGMGSPALHAAGLIPAAWLIDRTITAAPVLKELYEGEPVRRSLPLRATYLIPQK